jgi:hypothetical protein
VTAVGDGLKVHWEWQAAPGVKSPEHRATWARIEIAVGADRVTLVEDADSSSSRRSVYCSLYPLAEWVAFNWWLLKANSRPMLSVGAPHGVPVGLPGREGADARRHCMRSIGDGFLWPNLYILPDGTETLLRWSADRQFMAGRRIRYISQGYQFVDSDQVMQSLAGTVEAVIIRLADQGISNLPLHEEWEAITSADADEVEFCVAAARLGLDPYSEADGVEEALERASRSLEGAMLEDFLNSVNPNKLDSGLDWVVSTQDAVARAADDHGEILSVADAVRSEDVGRMPPWQLGWRQARRVRRELGSGATEKVEPESYVGSLNRPSGDRGLQAVGGVGQNENGIAVALGGAAGSDARRFTLSRALWHFLADDSRFFLITSTYAERQKVERAFAAELLAPADGIRALLQDDEFVEDDLDEIAEHFGVSPRVIELQVQNQLSKT